MFKRSKQKLSLEKVPDLASAGADLSFDSVKDERDSSMDITSATIDSGNDFVSYEGVVNDMDVPKTGDADPVMNMKKKI